MSDGIMYVGIIECIGRYETRTMSDGIMYKIGRLQVLQNVQVDVKQGLCQMV